MLSAQSVRVRQSRICDHHSLWNASIRTNNHLLHSARDRICSGNVLRICRPRILIDDHHLLLSSPPKHRRINDDIELCTAEQLSTRHLREYNEH